MYQLRTGPYILLFVAIFTLSGCTKTVPDHVVSGVSSSCLSSGWPHDNSDLRPDPSVLFGTLDNGFRYVIMPNREPLDRVGMYLDVQAGSLQENDNQRGLAHYLEHMLFNGTVHYPPGTLVEFFQSIGMGFGADTNAHTSYNETVYKLLLPRGDQQTLDKGLEVMADYARGALLLEQEVDRERGIILAEKRARDSAESRVYKEKMRFAFAGTRVAERDVIGTEKSLQKADAKLLREYYDTWYRPENMILVVVGDVKPKMVQAMVEQRFSSLRAASIPLSCPEMGLLPDTGVASFYKYEPDLGATDVTIESLWNASPVVDTRDEELHQIREYIAGTVFDNRLQHLVSMEKSPMTKAHLYAGRFLQRYKYTSLTAKCSAENWQKSLEFLEQTLRQALSQGFTEAELIRARKQVLTMLTKEARAAKGRTSDTIADTLISSLNRNVVFLSPGQELSLYGEVVRQVSLSEINDAFRSLWHERRLIEVVGAADIRQSVPSPEDVVLGVYNRASQAEITPWQQEDAVHFPYLKPFATPARVTKYVQFHKIGINRYVFDNGVILNLKKTLFKPNEIAVTVSLGNGRLSEPEPGLALLSEMVVNESGVGRLTKEQLESALAASSSRVQFRVGEESFLFSGKGLRGESELLFQLLATHIKDPAFRLQALKRSREKLNQMYKQLESSVEGMMGLEGERFLAGGNSRYGLPPYSSLERLTLDQVKNWLAPVLQDQGLEISVVGDVNPEKVVQLVSRYFAGSAREGWGAEHGSQIEFPAGKVLDLSVPTASAKALLVVGWPTDDFWDISRTRRLNVLATVLDDRLRKQIREELGATYSPYVYNRSSRVDPGFGVLRAQMIVAPEQAEMLVKKLKQAGKELALGGVSEEELERALEPVITSIKDMVRTNQYWLQSVLVLSSRHPRQLEWPLTIEKDFAAVTARELSDLAAKYLQPEAAAEVILHPDAP